MIAAVQTGNISRELLESLAATVLEDELVRLATEVREGGPHAVRRAIELAALLLARRATEASGRAG